MKYLIGIILLVVTTLIFSCDSMCGNEVLEQKISPNHKVKLVKFNRDCGATTAGSIQISLIGIDESIGNSAGNIFISHIDTVSMSWIDDKTVSITLRDSFGVFSAKRSLGDFTITYNTFHR